MRFALLLCIGAGTAIGTAVGDAALGKRDLALDQQQLDELPQCPRTCLDKFFPTTTCQLDSPSCLCNPGDTITGIETCITSNCTLDGSLALQNLLEHVCGRSIPDRGGLSRRLCWAMFAFATFFVICRVVSRSPTLGGTGYGSDDWTLLFCYALLVPTDVSAEIEVQNGLGLDVYMVPIANIVEILKWFYIGEILYNIIVMLTKISILLLYLRIWSVDSTTPRFRLLCWSLISLLTATFITGIFTIVFQCSPVAYAWLQVTGTQGHCIHLSSFTYVYAALNILFDIITFLLPIHNLLKLDIGWPKKMGVCSVFLCGFFVTVCSIVRLQYLARLGNTTNITWDFQYIGMWSLIECNFSIVCACMPAMAGLIQRCWMKTFGETWVASRSEKPGLVEGLYDGQEQRDGSGQTGSTDEVNLEQWAKDVEAKPESKLRDEHS